MALKSITTSRKIPAGSPKIGIPSKAKLTKGSNFRSVAAGRGATTFHKPGTNLTSQ